MAQRVLYHHRATLLDDGRVLVTGGQAIPIGQTFPDGVVSAEIYDPSTGRWSPTGRMFDPRTVHGAVLLSDGRVLVSGGFTDEHERDPASAAVTSLGAIASAEVYDPSTEAWSLVGDMSVV